RRELPPPASHRSMRRGLPRKRERRSESAASLPIQLNSSRLSCLRLSVITRLLCSGRCSRLVSLCHLAYLANIVAQVSFSHEIVSDLGESASLSSLQQDLATATVRFQQGRTMETKPPVPRAILVGIQLPGVDDAAHAADMEELGRLVKTLGYQVVGTISQRRD